jgi:hypothetical protein
MVVPREALDEPGPADASEITLESGGYVVCVGEVESLGHVDLAEHREQSLLLDEVLDLVWLCDWEQIRTL